MRIEVRWIKNFPLDSSIFEMPVSLLRSVSRHLTLENLTLTSDGGFRCRCFLGGIWDLRAFNPSGRSETKMTPRLLWGTGSPKTQLPELTMAKAHNSVFPGQGHRLKELEKTQALPTSPQYAYGKPEVTKRGRDPESAACWDL